MKQSTPTPVGLLQQIADIERMEAGKLCVIGQGKGGPYYNLQCREHGKSVSRYVPRDQVETVQENTKNYRTFQKLVDQYAEEIVTRPREERLEDQKKRARPSSGSKMENSKV